MHASTVFRTGALLLLASLGAVLRAAEPAVGAEDERITLPKFEVKGNAICSYGIGVIAMWNKKIESFSHLYVDDVSPGSAADRLGLQHGDEILSLNGKKSPTGRAARNTVATCSSCWSTSRSAG